MNSSTLYEVAVVGAGPIGIELAVALKRAGISYIHFDAKQVGHTISWFAPQTRFFSSNERIAIADVPLVTMDQQKASREEYLAYLRAVVTQFDLPIRTFEPVASIVKSADGCFDIGTTVRGQPQAYRSRRVALVTGGTDHPRRLNVPGEDLPHVSQYFQDPHTYFRKQLLIVGGKNSAVEAALRCHHAGAHVSIVHRRAELPEKSIKYWLMPEINGLIKSGRIQFYASSVIKKISPTHVTLAKSEGEEKQFDVPADFVLTLIGYEQDQTLLRNAGVQFREHGTEPVFDPATMESNIKGIYLAGTAIAGTQQRFAVFIENCHEHIDKIMQAMFAIKIDRRAVQISSPES